MANIDRRRYLERNRVFTHIYADSDLHRPHSTHPDREKLSTNRGDQVGLIRMLFDLDQKEINCVKGQILKKNSLLPIEESGFALYKQLRNTDRYSFCQSLRGCQIYIVVELALAIISVKCQ